jgi:uncharacterized protein (DUF1697 family)
MKMPRYVALLRGVNVGRGNRVPMADFEALLEDLGCTGVRTLLNSGNAVFTSTGRSQVELAESIAAELEKRLAVKTRVIVKSAAELSEIVDASPMSPPDAEHSTYLVAFAAEADHLLALAPLQDLARAPERFVVTRVAAFLHCPSGLLQSRVGKALLGDAGKRITTRTWATVQRLHALADDDVA